MLSCRRDLEEQCDELETGLAGFLARERLERVVVWGHKSTPSHPDTHGWIHDGLHGGRGGSV